MTAIRTVNLSWEKRVRGSYPPSPYGLGNDGTLCRAVPRPLESRSYDLAWISHEEAVMERGFFSAETLTKLDIAADAQTALGMTADDIYLFRDGGKTRFLGERQFNYVDAALCAKGQSLAVLFSDVSGMNFGLAFGGIGGRVAWMREADSPLTAITISRDGKCLAYGAEDGRITLLTAGMTELWTFEQEEPIRAVACSEDGTLVAYGTADGNVGWIDGSGARRWEMRFPGEIASLALSGDGALCGVLVHPKGDAPGTKLACLTGNGQVGWEYHTAKRLLRVSVSANGRWLATGSRDGTTTVYEVVPSELTGGIIAAALQNKAELRAAELERTGDLMGAFRLLREAMESDYANVALCERAFTIRGQWRANLHAELKSLSDAKNWLAVIETAEKMLADDPHNPATIAFLNGGLREQAKSLLEQARQSEPGQKEALLFQALTYSPFLMEARAELAAIHAHRAEDAEAEAERCLASGELESAVGALERAQSLAPTTERAKKIRQTQVEAEYAAGFLLYNEKRYEQAAFQLRKVLAREPGHADAKRYLKFAQNFAQNPADDSETDRFNFLE